MCLTINCNIVIFSCIWVMLISGKTIDAVIGLNWGRQSATTLIPSMVVDLLLQNKVPEVKLYSGDLGVIKAFSGTGIGVNVTIASAFNMNQPKQAEDWIYKTINPFPNVNFRYVSVGNNAFSTAQFSNQSLSRVVERLKWTQNALTRVGRGDKVKAVMSHTFNSVLTYNNIIPSKAEFLPNLTEAMAETLSFMSTTNAPFIVEFNPIALVHVLQLDPEFTFPDGNSTVVITNDENGFVYTNLFDLVYDSFIWALKKIGYGNVKIIVGYIGWPTDGYQGANVDAAQRYWKGMLPKVSSNKGTPMRPGSPIDIYIHSLCDEKGNPSFLLFTRHWGIYRSNGEPKYMIDLSGQGLDIYPTRAHGYTLMPGRWCVFNEDIKDPELVKTQFKFACDSADCTTLSPGGSCGMLTYIEQVSFAFNVYFQTNYQDENSCNFKGLGKLIVQNPSRDGCVFPVEVVKGNQPPAMNKNMNAPKNFG